MNKRIRQCPVCNEALEITEYHCPHCDITIQGRFNVSDLGSLNPAQQEFVKVFICCGGNLKEVEKRLRISYPTIKNRLSEIQKLVCTEDDTQPRDEVLELLNEGRISVDEALSRLKNNQ